MLPDDELNEDRRPGVRLTALLLLILAIEVVALVVWMAR
jgi:hypothetical protein